MKKILFILLTSFVLFPWFVKTEEVTAKKVDGINKYHFVTFTQSEDEDPPGESSGDGDESSDKEDDKGSGGEPEIEEKEPIEPEENKNENKGNKREPSTNVGTDGKTNTPSKNNDKKTTTKTPGTTPRQQTNVQRPTVQPWQGQIRTQTDITVEMEEPTTAEAEDDGIVIDEDKDDEMMEESEDKDETLTIEQLKQMDIIIRNEDGKYYVIYKDENNNIIKQEITKYEAMQLGYEDDVVQTNEAMADHITLTTNNQNGTLKKIFGVIAVTLTSLGLIAGTYIYYRRKIA